MSFIVIEGDNGTGKDTLAVELSKKIGFYVITNFENVVTINKNAKAFTGMKRLENFIAYNKVCSEIACQNNSLAVRYFLSTLAAAYADGVLTYEQTLKLEKKHISELFPPDLIIFLWCDYEKRIDRIIQRNSEDFDDMTFERNNKYKFYLLDFQKRTKFKCLNIDTTDKDILKVLEIAENAVIKVLGEKNGD